MSEHLNWEQEALEEVRAKKLSILRLIDYIGNLLKSESESDREKGKFLKSYLDKNGWHLN